MILKTLEPLKKDLNVVIYLFKLAHRISKGYIPVVISSALIKAVMPFLNLIMMKYMVDELMGDQRGMAFVWLIALTTTGNLLLNLFNRTLEAWVVIKNEELLNGFDVRVGEKIMALDFEMIEDPEILDLKERALFPLHNQGVISRMIEYTMALLSLSLTMSGLIAMISFLSPWLIALLIVMAGCTSLINKKAQKIMFKFYQLLIPVNRKFGYYAQVTSDFSYAKDIRLYQMDELLLDRIEEYNETSLSVFAKLYTAIGRHGGYSEIVLQVQMILVYAYMTYKVITRTIGLGDFTMYVGAATQFGQCLSKFLNLYMEMTQLCRYMDVYLEFDALEPRQQKGIQLLDLSTPPIIEFKQVSFKYPKSDQYALKDVSITIQAGEKLSIVGLNGAGKTTFIKLLTRLYEPTEGGIYVNGVNILDYDLKAYLDLMSVVFQDFKLLAFSIQENIVFDEAAEDVDILEVLKEAGFEEDLVKLPCGIKTPIYKTFEEDGIEFSGGQSQKIAIARAIYKDSPLVILDEPTSALDPIAEFDIYHRFSEMVGDKTTLYISHRLSSCLLSDRIAVFKGGELIELGTHDELMKARGLYQEMYDAQAKYYAS